MWSVTWKSSNRNRRAPFGDDAIAAEELAARLAEAHGEAGEVFLRFRDRIWMQGGHKSLTLSTHHAMTAAA
jgi:hypothetical protein